MPYSANATRAQDMLVPEVWASMVQAEFPNRLVWGALGFSDSTLEGQPGDTVHFPKWGALTDAVDVAENEDLPIERLTTTDDTATIKEAGKAVEITDRAMLYGYGDPVGEAMRQLGIVIARKIDADVQADALANAGVTGTYANTGFSEAALWAMLDEFGEIGADPANFAAFILNSAQHSLVRSSDFFNSGDRVGDGNQANIRGYVGAFASVPVIVSDRMTAGTAVLLRENAVGVLYKRRPQVERDRDILARANLMTTNVHYGTKTINPDGIAVYTQAA